MAFRHAGASETLKKTALSKPLRILRGDRSPSFRYFFSILLERDILAVEAAVTEKWSNGIVEGLVNRLKTLKRQMYGRASVELLRARLMPLAQNPSVQRE
jgi:transposase